MPAKTEQPIVPMSKGGRVPSAPGSREPSPEGLGPPGFDPSRAAQVAILYGYVEEIYHKRGLRTVHFEAIYPYQHRATIDVTGDPGGEDDDALTGALYPFCAGLVAVTADVDEQGELSARPSRFAVVPCDSDGSPEGEDSRSEAECEASQSGAAKTAHRPKGGA